MVIHLNELVKKIAGIRQNDVRALAVFIREAKEGEISDNGLEVAVTIATTGENVVKDLTEYIKNVQATLTVDEIKQVSRFIWLEYNDSLKTELNNLREGVTEIKILENLKIDNIGIKTLYLLP